MTEPSGRKKSKSTKSGFFQEVYKLVAAIPPGKVMTYGQIAAVLNTTYSAQLVGFAMNAAPAGANLPCHRVVNRKGEMSPGWAFGGPGRQRELLEAEGTPFLADGRVDVQAALYWPQQIQ